MNLPQSEGSPFQSATSSATTVDAGLRAYMLRVYNWMASGLVLTGIVAAVIAGTSVLNYFYQPIITETGASYQITSLGYFAIFAPIGFVLLLRMGINKLSTTAAQAVFWSYCGLMGVSLAIILMLYTETSVARTFFVAAGTFGGMSIWGYTTKTDLTRWGSFLMMGVIGLVLALVVNMFVRSSGMDLLISLVGVLVFTALTAYRTQRIKTQYLAQSATDTAESIAKRSVLDALGLYLSFINLFLMLLRLSGGRRR